MGFGHYYWVAWPRGHPRTQSLANYNNWAISWGGIAVNSALLAGGIFLVWRFYTVGSQDMAAAVTLLGALYGAATYFGVPWWISNQTDEGEAIAFPPRSDYSSFAQEWFDYAMSLPEEERPTELSLRWTNLQGMADLAQRAATGDLTERIGAVSVLLGIMNSHRPRWRKK